MQNSVLARTFYNHAAEEIFDKAHSDSLKNPRFEQGTPVRKLHKIR